MTGVKVTTSWDDGHMLDIRLAVLLKKYGIAGTFYIAPHNRELPAADRLTDGRVQELASEFEIGAHTMTHPVLTDVDDEVARGEITESKIYLEKLLGKPIKSFCYPRGAFRSIHELMVKDAGYKIARTVVRGKISIGNNRFAIPTTMHAYQHWSDTAIFTATPNVRTLSRYLNWESQACALFDEVLEKGGVYHLWGHSWEIDAHRHWEKLEKVLAYIGGRAGVSYVANAELA